MLRTEFDEMFTNGGAVDTYPIVEGTISKNNITIIYHYNNDGCTQAFLDRNNISNSDKIYHLPTKVSSISVSTDQVLKALGIN